MTSLPSAGRLATIGLTILVTAGSGATGAAASGATGTSAAATGGGHATKCARQFDDAVRAYVETTENRDAAGFNALLAPDATGIFANGGVLYGRDQFADFITSFFADPGWSQSFTELTRHVEDCRSAFVLFDSVYRVPADDRVAPLVIGVTFTYRHGRWLVLHNQDSDGPAS